MVVSLGYQNERDWLSVGRCSLVSKDIKLNLSRLPHATLLGTVSVLEFGGCGTMCLKVQFTINLIFSCL